MKFCAAILSCTGLLLATSALAQPSGFPTLPRGNPHEAQEALLNIENSLQVQTPINHSIQVLQNLLAALSENNEWDFSCLNRGWVGVSVQSPELQVHIVSSLRKLGFTCEGFFFEDTYFIKLKLNPADIENMNKKLFTRLSKF